MPLDSPEATTKVSDHNSTAVPKAVRNNQQIEPGDRLGWYKQDGRWYVQRIDEEGN
jgi:bifunctional DNA-binding transcriptional regulator/antitoxin component of YhaV-PrlF toxin-antitoxin module